MSPRPSPSDRDDPARNRAGDAPATLPPATPRSWWTEITPLQWKTLLAAQAGWMLDAMDVMLYAFALTAIQAEFGLSSARAGAVASATLLAAALGGVTCGVLADRFGRARMLAVSVLIYSLCTALTATAHAFGALVLWRALVGLGLGAEWTAGSVLVAETWPARHRGKAIGIMQSGWAIGTTLAAGLAATLLHDHGWRPLFLIGALPALLAAWVRRSVPEPELWLRQRAADSLAPTASAPRAAADVRTRTLRALPFAAMLRRPLLVRTLTATLMATALLCAYWGLFTWIPTFLAAPVQRGGAGLGVVRSLTWICTMQAGAFLGYLLFGVLADRFGRRPVFLVFVLAAAVLVPAYGLGARSARTLLVLSPLLGFFGHGYFSVFGAMLAELFPSAIRATAQGFCYNAGRAVSAAAPALIGALADRFGIGSALAVTSLFYVAGAAAMLGLPETRGRALA